MAFKSLQSRPDHDADKSRKTEFSQEALTPPEPKISHETARSSQPVDDNLKDMENDFYSDQNQAAEHTPEPEIIEPEPDQTPETPEKPRAQSEAEKAYGGELPSGLNSAAARDTSKTRGNRAAPSSKSPAGRKTLNGGTGANGASLGELAAGATPGLPTPGGSAGRPKEGYFKRNRKFLIAGGGISAVLISLILGFFAVLPLKLIAITKSIEKHEVARVDDYVSRRVDAVIYRYLFHAVTGADASDGFYMSNNILSTLYGNMRLNNFEGKLAEKGIVIKKTGPRSLSFQAAPGVAAVDINSPEAFVNHMNQDLKGKQARKAIKEIVDHNYRPLQILRRHQMRKYIMNAYNIKRWSIKKENDQKNPDNPDMPGSTMLAVQSRIIDPPSELTANSIDCVFGSPCPDPNVRNNPDGTSKFRPGIPQDRNAGEQEAIDNTKKGIRDSYKTMKESTTKTLTAGLSKLVGPVIADTIIKSTPIVGWLALAADLDHFFWNGTLVKIGVMLHSAQYASVAIGWASLADQAKAGQLTASQINELNVALNDIEKSNAMQRIVFDNPNAGVKLSKEQRVGSDELVNLPPSEGFPGCDIGWLGSNLATSPPSGGAFWTFLYRQATAFPLGPHTPLCVLHSAIDTLAGLVNFFIGDAVSFLTQAAINAINESVRLVTGDRNADIMVYAQNAIIWMAAQIWTPVASGRETGAALGNAIDAGWDVTANQMCRDSLGCKNISNTVTYEQEARIAAENRADLASRGLLASLFDIESPHAIGSQLVVMMPTTPDSVIDRLDTVAFAMASDPFKFFGRLATTASAPAYAADPNSNPNGVQQTGFVEAELSDAVLHVATVDKAGPPGSDGNYTGPDGRIDEYDCDPIEDANTPNQCLIDTAAAQVLCSSMSTDDDGGLGGNGQAGGCGGVRDQPSAYLPDANPGASSNPLSDFLSLFSATLKWSSR